MSSNIPPKHQAQPVPADAITFIAAYGMALPKVTLSLT